MCMWKLLGKLWLDRMKKSTRTENKIAAKSGVRELVYVQRFVTEPGPACGFATSV